MLKGVIPKRSGESKPDFSMCPTPKAHQLAIMVAGTESKEQASIDILSCVVKNRIGILMVKVLSIRRVFLSLMLWL